MAACRPDIKETKKEYKFFDLRGYMKADSTRLKKLNPLVHKTVSHNGDSQTQDTKIGNWGHELSLFTSSDINKPSWRESYKTENTDSSTIYNAITPSLKTQQLEIIKSGDQVKAIHIVNHTKNLLYETTEKLSYLPDSLYTIDKTQHVLFLGTNHYVIKGVLKK
ncbi:hypothetical protein [Mucilaginibacter sp. KACC 22063]|uniref:hypothetical protein n=1 Tax=Mucilaginibacter sp. KACC 22063 TaxID=3025666 RepID=UPI0023660F9D|nr:hypothetical protein [Mucilaginibacter sp. KACC 22063]WDF56856.1 hypothetical protein PQ461_07280 [Mucilaginibacter sp. KACC 22063]